MILSASGWRKVFAESGNENDFSEEIGKDNRILCVHIAENFASFLKEQTKKRTPSVTVAKDTRPTGKQISQIFIKALFNSGIKVHYIGTASAPEIMAYSRCTDGFVYISASHNPVGHNGIKFGLNDGGVMDGEKSKLLIKQFNERLSAVNAVSHAEEVLSIPDSKIQKIIKKAQDIKNDSLKY